MRCAMYDQVCSVSQMGFLLKLDHPVTIGQAPWKISIVMPCGIQAIRRQRSETSAQEERRNDGGEGEISYKVLKLGPRMTDH